MDGFNKYQSTVESLGLNDKPAEIQEQFADFINNVPFIKNLISPERKRACELPRDKDGRAIIDLTEPHILEDMDYFRPSAIHFMQHGCYTKLKPNANPQSEFGKWIKEEIRRCHEGYIRESDGEWIPGDYYFFLNYSPMTMVVGDEDSDTEGHRVIGFPWVWEGHYMLYHYKWQARRNGHHSAVLAARGVGKTSTGASELAKRFVLGESPKVNKKVASIAAAYDKKYLTNGADQTLDKFQFIIDFLAEKTQFPRKRLASSPKNMEWVMGFYNLETGTRQGTLNSVTGISAKDDIDKLRGSRGVYYIIEEFGCHIGGTEVIMSDGSIRKVEDIVIGDKLMGPDGTPRIVQECHTGIDDMYKITLSNGDVQIVNSNHLIHFKHRVWANSKTKYKEVIKDVPVKDLIKLKSLDKGNYILKANIEYPSKKIDLDPYYLGLWLGDGDSKCSYISNEDQEVIDWFIDYCKSIGVEYAVKDLKQSKTCKNLMVLKQCNKVITALRKYNLLDNKHIPDDYLYNDHKTQLELLAGVIDTDGTYYEKKKFYEITQHEVRKDLIYQLKFLCDNLGLKTNVSTRVSGPKAKKPNQTHYRLRISGDISMIPCRTTRKKPTEKTNYRNRLNCNEYTFKIEYYGKDRFYGFTLDKDHLFVLKDFTIVHNSFKNLKKLYGALRPSVEQGKKTFGLINMIGTSSEINSNFESAKELITNPIGYNINAVKNLYDKYGQGRPYFSFFFPSYINRDGCYDKNGNSDVTKALLEILEDRYKVKYNTDDLNALSRRIGEYPITPQEAMLKVRNNLFPIQQLTDRINQLDNNPNSFDDIYVGKLDIKTNGEVVFVPTNDVPIRKYPLGDNKAHGAIEIFSMPLKDSTNKVPRERYIVSFDPVDSDESETMSLVSAFVLDLWTDKIVAEYTGRQDRADDNYEIVRRLCMFYNAKCLYENNIKGTYQYFVRLNCTYLLADTPEYLKDRDIIKQTGYGNVNKGVAATMPINNYADRLIKEWLLKPITVVSKDEQGDEHENTVPNLYFIKNRALLQELANYDDKNNFDRVRSLGMLMLYREAFIVRYGGTVGEKPDKSKDPAYRANDPFFKKNYDDRVGISL